MVEFVNLSDFTSYAETCTAPLFPRKVGTIREITMRDAAQPAFLRLFKRGRKLPNLRRIL